MVHYCELNYLHSRHCIRIQVPTSQRKATLKIGSIQHSENKIILPCLLEQRFMFQCRDKCSLNNFASLCPFPSPYSIILLEYQYQYQYECMHIDIQLWQGVHLTVSVPVAVAVGGKVRCMEMYSKRSLRLPPFSNVCWYAVTAFLKPPP